MQQLESISALLSYSKENTNPVRLILGSKTTDKQLAELSTSERALQNIQELFVVGATVTHEGAQSFFGSPGLRDLQVLRWENVIISFGVIEAFYSDERYQSLHTLEIMGTYLDEEAWEKWIFYSWWKKLRTLKITFDEMSDRFAEALTWNDGLENLEHFALHSKILTDYGANKLSIAKLNPAIQTFDVESPVLTNKGWSSLLAQKNLPEAARTLFTSRAKKKATKKDAFSQLDTLLQVDLSKAPNREALVEYLSSVYQKSATVYQKEWAPYIQRSATAWPWAFEIEALRARPLELVAALLPDVWIGIVTPEPKFGGVEWASLVGSKSFARVREFTACEQGISVEEAKVFAKSPNIKNLQKLSFSLGVLGDEIVAVLLASRQLKSLHTLDLSTNDLTNKTTRALLQSPFFSQLTTLDLSYGAFDEETVELLCQSEAHQHLRSLKMASNKLTDRALELLSSSKLLASLEYLSLESNSGLTSQGVEAFLKALPLQNLKRLILSDKFIKGSKTATALKKKGLSFVEWWVNTTDEE